VFSLVPAGKIWGGISTGARFKRDLIAATGFTPVGKTSRSDAVASQPKRSALKSLRMRRCAKDRVRSTIRMMSGITFCIPLEINCTKRAGSV
jgi:hypothetical protein